MWREEPARLEPPMITTEVADRVYRLSHAYVSCYLVEDDGRVLLVGAGLPAMWPMLAGALREHALRPDDIEGLVLTHAHFDHTGFAARVQSRLGVPVWAHANDF